MSYRNDPLVAQYQSWNLPFSLDDAKEFITGMLQGEINIKGKWHQIAIENKESSVVIGDCAVHTSVDGKQAEFGITIAKQYQNKGYAYEALHTLFDYLFNTMNYHRITALVDSSNKSSIALNKKLGMRQEGYFIESYFGREFTWTDEIQFAILKKEFIL